MAHLPAAALTAVLALSGQAATPPAPPAAPPTSPAPGAPSTGTPAPPAATPAPPAATPHATVGALLDAAEAVAATLADFHAKVTLETSDDVTGDTERRTGEVVLQQQKGKPATRTFAVVFTTFVDGSGRLDQRPVRYLYADGWITEADFTQRTLLRRQLAYPGESYDPLKPGEGPVPLPVGQRRAEVERRFETALATQPAAPALARMPGIQGVVLTPRAGMADRDLVRATVWYDLATMAPVGVEAERKNGRTTVVLRGATLNGGLTDEQGALLKLAAGDTAGWRVDERPLPPKAP